MSEHKERPAEMVELVNTPSEPPKKVHYDMVLIFAWLGLGMLLPWNCFINSYAYFMYQFHDNKTYEKFWTSSLGICTMLIMLLTIIANALFSATIPRNRRIYPSLILMACMFGFTTVMTKIDTKEWVSGFFAVTLVSVAIINAAAAVFQGAFFGIAGNFPGVYFNAMLQGQAIAGVFPATLAIVAKLIFPDSQTDSALMFFLIASATVIGCVAAYRYLISMPKANAYIPAEQCGSENRKSFGDLIGEMVQVFKITYYQAASVTVVFWVTIAFFPAVSQLTISKCQSPNVTDEYKESGYCKNFSKDFFGLVFNFLLFNTGDWFGRWLVTKYKVVGKEQGGLLLLLSVSRVVFGVAFLFTRRDNYDGLGFLGEDWAYVVIMALFSISNGYIGAIAFEYGPQMVPPAMAELTASILPVFLATGLLLGAVSSFATVSILPVNVNATIGSS